MKTTIKIMEQALEINGVSREDRKKIIEDYLLLYMAESSLVKAENTKGKRIENEETRKELRKILAYKLKANIELLTFKIEKAIESKGIDYVIENFPINLKRRRSDAGES